MKYFFKRLFCNHKYTKVDWYQIDNGYKRYSIRKYKCEKCGKEILVDGRYDTLNT